MVTIRVLVTCLTTLLVPAVGLAQTSADDIGFMAGLAGDVRTDFRNHYQADRLGNLAIGFGVSAVIANSDADKNVQRFFNEKLSGDAGDDLADFFTRVGDVAQPLPSVPIYLGAMWLGGYSKGAESSAARWGANSLRAVVVGTPELIVLAYVTGGQRPEEGEPGWNPFDDYNGVSGHSFYGAVPIITAARMTDSRWAKYTLYAASALPGLARVYDDKHYFSQSFLGWWLAYLATETVEHTNLGEQRRVRVIPVPYPDGGGVQVTVRF